MLTRQERAQRVAEKLGLKIEGFTQGPWKYAFDADGDHVIISDCGQILAVTSGNEYVDFLEDEANAQLMSYAPTLWNHLIDLEEEVLRLMKELADAKS